MWNVVKKPRKYNVIGQFVDGSSTKVSGWCKVRYIRLWMKEREKRGLHRSEADADSKPGAQKLRKGLSRQGMNLRSSIEKHCAGYEDR